MSGFVTVTGLHCCVSLINLSLGFFVSPDFPLLCSDYLPPETNKPLSEIKIWFKIQSQKLRGQKAKRIGKQELVFHKISQSQIHIFQKKPFETCPWAIRNSERFKWYHSKRVWKKSQVAKLYRSATCWLFQLWSTPPFGDCATPYTPFWVSWGRKEKRGSQTLSLLCSVVLSVWMLTLCTPSQLPVHITVYQPRQKILAWFGILHISFKTPLCSKTYCFNKYPIKMMNGATTYKIQQRASSRVWNQIVVQMCDE